MFVGDSFVFSVSIFGILAGSTALPRNHKTKGDSDVFHFAFSSVQFGSLEVALSLCIRITE